MKKSVFFVIALYGSTAALYSAADESGSLAKAPVNLTKAYIYLELKTMEDQFLEARQKISSSSSASAKDLMKTICQQLSPENIAQEDWEITAFSDNPAEDLKKFLAKRLPIIIDNTLCAFQSQGVSFTELKPLQFMIVNDRLNELKNGLCRLHNATSDALRRFFFLRHHLQLQSAETIDWSTVQTEVEKAYAIFSATLVTNHDVEKIQLRDGTDEELEKLYREFQIPLDDQTCTTLFSEAFEPLKIKVGLSNGQEIACPTDL